MIALSPTSATHTRTTPASAEATYTLPLTGRATPPPSSGLLVEPLVHSGALNETDYPRVQLTPAIGIQFGKETQLKKVLQLPVAQRDAVLKDLALEISTHGLAVFSAQDDLTPADLAVLGLALGTLAGKPESSTLHIHPTQELGENGLPIGQITNVADEDGRQISFMDEGSSFASAGWHTDVSFEPVPANYTLLRMHTLPITGGDTLFASAYAHYDALSPAMASFLEGLTATHHAEMFREQSRRHGFALRTLPRGSPENSGDLFRASHPVIRTNPVTGLKGLFVNATFTSRINELSFDESKALLSYLFTLQHQSHNSQVRFRWFPNDLAIWDNRTTSHVATFDYEELRVGDRVVCVGEKPYLDPKSTGRRERDKARRA